VKVSITELLANILVQANDSPEGLTGFPPTMSSAERIFSSVLAQLNSAQQTRL
jgi:hypothetical protein